MLKHWFREKRLSSWLRSMVRHSIRQSVTEMLTGAGNSNSDTHRHEADEPLEFPLEAVFHTDVIASRMLYNLKRITYAQATSTIALQSGITEQVQMIAKSQEHFISVRETTLHKIVVIETELQQIVAENPCRRACSDTVWQKDDSAWVNAKNQGIMATRLRNIAYPLAMTGAGLTIPEISALIKTFGEIYQGTSGINANALSKLLAILTVVTLLWCGHGFLSLFESSRRSKALGWISTVSLVLLALSIGLSRIGILAGANASWLSSTAFVPLTVIPIIIISLLSPLAISHAYNLWQESNGLISEAVKTALEGGYPGLADSLLNGKRTHSLNWESRRLKRIIRSLDQDIYVEGQRMNRVVGQIVTQTIREMEEDIISISNVLVDKMENE